MFPEDEETSSNASSSATLAVRGVEQPTQQQMLAQRRTNAKRACTLCRKRKQRCNGEQPCSRCEMNKLECVYVTKHQERQQQLQKLQLQLREEGLVSDGHSSALIEMMQVQFAKLNERLDRIERVGVLATPPPTSRPAKVPDLLSVADETKHLRYLTGLFKGLPDNSWNYDPVSLGLLSEQEVKELGEIYCEWCHRSAPILDKHYYRSIDDIRATSKFLFVVIMAVAARNWVDKSTGELALHPKYSQLSLMESYFISRLLISGVYDQMTLDIIEALLIYTQNMPLKPHLKVPAASFNIPNMYNMLAFAISCSRIFRLEEKIAAAFSVPEPSPEGFRMLRVMLCLLCTEYYMMLTFKFPATLDPEPYFAIATQFVHHPLVGSDHLNCLAVLEVIQLLCKGRKRVTDLNLDLEAISYINLRLDEYRAKWDSVLAESRIAMVAGKWSRLLVNTYPLCHEFTSTTVTANGAAAQSMLLSMKIAVDSAGTLINSFSVQPSSELVFDEPLVHSFQFSKDSHWYIHGFAIFFLCIAYAKRGVNDSMECQLPMVDLNELILRGDTVAGPQVGSPFHRILTVAKRLFKPMTKLSWHPACQMSTTICAGIDTILESRGLNMFMGKIPVPLAPHFSWTQLFSLNSDD